MTRPPWEEADPASDRAARRARRARNRGLLAAARAAGLKRRHTQKLARIHKQYAEWKGQQP